MEKGYGLVPGKAGSYVLDEAGGRDTRGKCSRLCQGKWLPKIGASVHVTLCSQKQNRLLTHSLTA
jgi:hypothetical protein